MKNHYTILGIGPTATPEEIKRAYKKLALRYHPDRNGNNPETTENFKAVTEAYTALSGTKNKVCYDDPLKDAKEYLRDLRSIFEERMKEKKEVVGREEQKREETIRKKKKLLQQERDLEDIIAEKEHKKMTASIVYHLPALGTAAAGGAIIYADNIEYGFAAFGLSLFLGFVGRLKN